MLASSEREKSVSMLWHIFRGLLGMYRFIGLFVQYKLCIHCYQNEKFKCLKILGILLCLEDYYCLLKEI